MIQYCIIFLLQLFSLTGATESGIVGGKVAKPHSRPYMVSLQVREHHVCGGILIRKDFVLTSAHCKQRSEALMVVLGAHNITKKEKSQQRIPVAKYHEHPKYTGEYSYDVMLLKLKTNAILNRYVKTIGLPKKAEKTLANVKCSVAGWGRTGPTTPSSDVLRETIVKVQFDDECSYKWSTYLREQMMCTHSDKKKAGICQGDSGGPLICNTKPQGISAFTKVECDDNKYPNVFMKINFFLPWIKSVMQG